MEAVGLLLGGGVGLGVVLLGFSGLDGLLVVVVLLVVSLTVVLESVL